MEDLYHFIDTFEILQVFYVHLHDFDTVYQTLENLSIELFRKR